MVAQPAPQQLSSVQVLRRKADGGWSDEWVDLADDISLNRIDTDQYISIVDPVPVPPTPGLLSNVADAAINELSGSAYSHTTSDGMWVNNDENGPVYMLQPSDGSTIGSVTFGGVGSQSDPEAMATGPDGMLYLADIGDNKNKRTTKKISFMPDPGPGTHGTLPAQKWDIQYQGGLKRNAECFMVNPVTNEKWIITKESAGRLFRLPDSMSTSSVNIAINWNKAMPQNVSDGCITPDGRWALLRCAGRSETLVYDTATWTFFTSVSTPSLSKGENVSVEPEGLSFLVSSEGVNPPIYRVLLPEIFWPPTDPPQVVLDNALRIRASVAEETYPGGVESICRRVVVWYLQDGNATWIRYPESSQNEEGRWWCSTSESGYYEFSISMPASTHYKLYIAAENYATTVDGNGQVTRLVGPSTEGSVWSDRYPVADPTSTSGQTIPSAGTLDVTWQFSDDDADSAQTQYGVQVRRAGYGNVPASISYILDTGAIDDYMTPSDTGTYGIVAADLPPNLYYEWRVAVRDHDLWSDWSAWSRFYVVGTSQTPIPLAPSADRSVDVTQPARFEWDFRDDVNPSTQLLANIRYRSVGGDDDAWVTLFGDITIPASNTFWVLPGGTFDPVTHYEWQVQTQSSSVSGLSDWSTSATFWTAPGTAAIAPDKPIFSSISQGTLGCGSYRVFVADRGGQTNRGEITPLATLAYDRRRDDISEASLKTNGFGDDCAALLKTLQCWMHEIVIFRDGVRVWEGPITRITEDDDGVEIYAHDPMIYVYRRALRIGYNDAYPNIQSVVFRATRIIQDALAYDDPNILGYLTPINQTGDARESRTAADWSKSAWEEVDDMAANSGLDYTTVGRRIILWDVHREIGRLPVMKNGDFSDPVVVTDYGMLTANVFAVTNNAGVYGIAQNFINDPGPLGYVEMVASQYGETDAAADTALTPQALASLQATLRGQAQRNLSGRYPTPRIVRVPDNTTILPDVEVGINQLIPGVRIPLHSVGRLRTVTQLQKLDKLSVTVDGDQQEVVKVTLSPAPDTSVESEPEALPE